MAELYYLRPINSMFTFIIAAVVSFICNLILHNLQTFHSFCSLFNFYIIFITIVMIMISILLYTIYNEEICKLDVSWRNFESRHYNIMYL